MVRYEISFKFNEETKRAKYIGSVSVEEQAFRVAKLYAQRDGKRVIVEKIDSEKHRVTGKWEVTQRGYIITDTAYRD